MKHKKDCYLVLSPSSVSWQCVVGRKLLFIPADDQWRVYSLHAGPEYGILVWIGKVS